MSQNLRKFVNAVSNDAALQKSFEQNPAVALKDFNVIGDELKYVQAHNTVAQVSGYCDGLEYAQAGK